MMTTLMPSPSTTPNGAKPILSRRALSCRLMNTCVVRVLGPDVAKVMYPYVAKVMYPFLLLCVTGSSLISVPLHAAVTGGYALIPNCATKLGTTRKTHNLE